MISNEMQQTLDAEQVAKRQAIFDKFYQLLTDVAMSRDELFMTTTTMPALLACMIVRLDRGNRSAQLETVDAIAECICAELERADPDATTLQ
jgi:hypothetical protein